MASLWDRFKKKVNEGVSGADWWDQEENRAQRQAFAAPKPVQPAMPVTVARPTQNVQVAPVYSQPRVTVAAPPVSATPIKVAGTVDLGLVDRGLDSGKSWEDISRETGIELDKVRAHSMKTRPNYGREMKEFVGFDTGEGENKKIFGMNAAGILPKAYEKRYEVKTGRKYEDSEERYLEQFDKIDEEFRNKYVNDLMEMAKDGYDDKGMIVPGDKAAKDTLKLLKDKGKLKGDFGDFLEGANERFYGGLTRGTARTAGLVVSNPITNNPVTRAIPGVNTVVDVAEQGRRETEKWADKQEAVRQVTDAGKTGENVGTGMKGAYDIASIMIPSGKGEQFLKGTKFVQNMQKGGKIQQILAKRAPGLVSDLTIGTGVEGVQEIGRGNEFDPVRSMLYSTGANVGIPLVAKPFVKGGRIMKQLFGGADDVAEQADTVLHLPQHNVYARVTKEQAEQLKDEVNNIPFTKGDMPHLTAGPRVLNTAKEVSQDEIRKLSPNASTALDNADNARVLPTTNRPAGEIQVQIEAARNAGDNAQVERLIKELPEDMQAPMRSAMGIADDTKLTVDPVTHKIVRVAKPEPVKPIKVVKTGRKDPELDKLIDARQSVIDIAADEKIAASTTRNLTKEILDNGGISSSAYESLPKGVRRTAGMSADKMAQVLGFESEDALMEALENSGKKLTKRQARELAEAELRSGKHAYSDDFAEMEAAVRAREDALALYPKGTNRQVRVTSGKPKAPSEEELLNLSETAPQGPRVTKYTEKAGKKILDPETDRMAQELVNGGASRDEIANLYMTRHGMVYGDALKEADRVKGFTQPPGVKELQTPKAGDPVDITGRPMKDPRMKKLMGDISASENLADVDARVTAADIIRVAKKNGVDTSDPGFIQRYQTGTITDKAEAEVAAVIKTHTDRVFAMQQALDPSIEYRQNYLPQSYKQEGKQVEEALNKLRTRTGAANKRAFSTYAEAQEFGLSSKYDSVEQMVADNVRAAQAATNNRKLINEGIESGIFSTKPADRTWKAVEGFDVNGTPVYASPKAANIINNAMQESSDAISKTVRGLGAVNRNWQDIMLAGGVPYSPMNFFVFGQMVKEMTAGRVSSMKDLVLSFSDTLTRKRFAQSQDFVREMAERGVPFNIKNAIDDSNWLSKKWGNAINKPTFERFMPNQFLSVAENTYKKALKKGLDEAAAKDLAADVVKKYYGVVDQVAKGRSTAVQNAINATFFAPRYRETIINTLMNTGKSVFNPKTWADPAYHMNRRLAAGIAITFVSADLLQRQLTGHGLMGNREGQEASIQIPIGGKDEKGNQQVINIPLMPGFLTIPRAIIAGTGHLLDGDAKGTIKEGSKVLATPWQTAGNVIGNADYFGRPIYNDAETAAREGIEEDSGGEKAVKVLKYVGGQLMPGYGRAARDWAEGKPAMQVIAQAGELPLRFGKVLNPETEAYFKDRDEIYASLDKNDQAVWDAIHPKLKNVNGEYMTDKTVDSGMARASNYLNNPKVLEAENEMAKRARDRGESTDPLWDLTPEQQRIALRMETLPPKDPNKKKLREDNEWLDDFQKQRSAFYDSLPKGDPNKPKSPIPYPEAPAEIEALRDAYYELEDPAQRREMMTRSPELADQFAAEEQYSRAVRAAKNLPQYDEYPEPTPEVQKLIDTYMALPKGEGAGGKSPTRSAWIKSHPAEWEKMTDQFSRSAQFNLQQDALMAAFEGEDLTEKGIKAISSLSDAIDKAMGDKSGGGFANRYGGSSGYISADFGDTRGVPGLPVTPVSKSVKVVRKKRGANKIKVTKSK